MKFGNWLVTVGGIRWEDNLQRFEIDMRDLLEKVTEDNGEMYAWIIRATEEDWLAEDDLYDFNFAFVYAAALTPSDFEYTVFDNTVAYQFELLDDEEEE